MESQLSWAQQTIWFITLPDKDSDPSMGRDIHARDSNWESESGY